MTPTPRKRVARKGGPAPSRSGTTWGDREYAAAGYGRITLRLPLDALDMLQAIADDMGESRAVAVDTLIRMEHEHNAITGRREPRE